MRMRINNNLLEVREASDSEAFEISGYFAVFNEQTELFEKAYELIEPQAFDDTLGDDIRALINHDTTLVIGRTAASTLELKVDNKGLFGTIRINPDDTDALNLYARVKRKDVSQCSIGFDILEESTEENSDGSVLWRIKKIKLYEVSVCTFPAYESTEVSVRKKELKEFRGKRLQTLKTKMKERLKKHVEKVDA